MLEYSKEEKDVGAGRRRRARMEHTPMKTLYQGGERGNYREEIPFYCHIRKRYIGG